MAYNVIFDISGFSYDYLVLLFLIGGSSFIELKYKFFSRCWKSNPREYNHLPQLLICMLLFPFLGMGFYICQKVSLLYSYHKGNYSITEGVVRDYVPVHPWGKGTENYTVNDQRFSYADDIITPGFNHTKSRGGPIKEGLQVRIWHVNGEIIRLEVAKER